MEVKKMIYWKICFPYFNYWGRKSIEKVSGKYGVADVSEALFTSPDIAWIVAREVLEKWDGYWGYPDSRLSSSVEFGDVKKEWVEHPSGLVLIRSGKVREKKVAKVTKKIVVDGEEYSKIVEEVSYGEWKDGEEEKISIEIYRHEVLVMGA
jgi:hypothetical protein